MFDTVMRLANHGYNPANVNLMGYRVMNGQTQDSINKLMQENGILRTELNKALGKLAGMPVITDMPSSPDSARDFRYAGIPDSTARQREFGAMPVSPGVAERQREYGAMPFQQPNVKNDRETRFGFAANKSLNTVASSVYGMQ